jgi:hypothetical protein
VDPIPDTLLLRKSGSAGNRTLTTRPQRRFNTIFFLILTFIKMIKRVKGRTLTVTILVHSDSLLKKLQYVQTEDYNLLHFLFANLVRTILPFDKHLGSAETRVGFDVKVTYFCPILTKLRMFTQIYVKLLVSHISAILQLF